MKKYWIIPFAFLIIAMIAACDKVDEPYATVKKIVPLGDRKILLEDFTGHTCVHCPKADKVAEGLKETGEGKVIVLTVHAGFYATPSSSGDFTYDFRTTEGEEIFTFFQVGVTPRGMVNRLTFDGERAIGEGEWPNAILSVLNLPPDAKIEITNQYDAPSRTLNTYIHSKFFSPFNDIYKLCAYILEDSIIAPQKNNNPEVGPTPTIYDYNHMNVLRGSMNGTWGDQLNTATIDTSTTYHSDYSMQLNPAWNAKNCKVMVYIYNEATKEIVQAEEEFILQEP